MTRILVVKHLGALRPVDEHGETVLHGLGQGEIVGIELKRPRNVLHHRKFFAMLSVVLKNQEHYKSVQDLLDVCKLRTGHCRTVQTKNGAIRIPSSISFAAMDQSAFEAFYQRACGWVIEEVLPGLQKRHLDEEVEAELLLFGTPEG